MLRSILREKENGIEEETNGLNAALDELLKGKTTEEIVGPNGLLKQLTKALLERPINAELAHHLGYEKGEAAGRGSGNNRNGASRKRVQGDFGSVEIAVPRDRNGSFEPQILPKRRGISALRADEISTSLSAPVQKSP